MRWGKDWCGLFSGLVLFRLVVNPLQVGVVGPYLVWSTWFPSHLPLEGIGPYLDFVGRNQRPAVPGVQDPDNIPMLSPNHVIVVSSHWKH
jgi:hypothetical protein